MSGTRTVPGAQFVGVEDHPDLYDTGAYYVEGDDRGDLVVVARHEAGGSVDGVGAQRGARVPGKQGQQAPGNSFAAGDRPRHRADLASAIEERGDVGSQQGRQTACVLIGACLSYGVSDPVLPTW